MTTAGRPAQTVIVLGGGIGGMSAAHELVERGFAVRVFERRRLAGGKARSVDVHGTGTDGRRDLPGEHGFRFFPRFYRHVTDTMARIPVGGGRTAFDNLVEASRDEIARAGRVPIVMPAWFPRHARDIELLLHDEREIATLGLSPEDLQAFSVRIWQLMSSCHDRASQEYERTSWFAYLGAESHSEAFRQILARGLTRTLVAATPKEASAEVGGTVLTELVYATGRPGRSDDRLLNGPTNDVWLTPWLTYLRSRGVDYRLDTEVTAIHMHAGRIAGVTVKGPAGEERISGDYYVSALPVERMNPLLTEQMVHADPTLHGIRTLAADVAWMTGIQFYMSERIPIIQGHVTYIDTAWALTSISQAQFWSGYDLSTFGDGTVRDILSVDISDWNAPGTLTTTKCADECTRDEIEAEVWAQLKASLNVDGHEVLRDGHKRSWYLDRDISVTTGGDHDAEPLLVNKAGRWVMRPAAHTAIPNFFLASDYVRTNTNLATMEAANEAARRAVNGIIDASGVDAPYCRIWPLYQPWMLAPLRWHDARRYAQGLAWDPRPPLVIRILHTIATFLGSIGHRSRPSSPAPRSQPPASAG